MYLAGQYIRLTQVEIQRTHLNSRSETHAPNGMESLDQHHRTVVEAAGIEPASEDLQPKASTCLS